MSIRQTSWDSCEYFWLKRTFSDQPSASHHYDVVDGLKDCAENRWRGSYTRLFSELVGKSAQLPLTGTRVDVAIKALQQTSSEKCIWNDEKSEHWQLVKLNGCHFAVQAWKTVPTQPEDEVISCTSCIDKTRQWINPQSCFTQPPTRCDS